VGRIRYLGVVLYDADRIAEAASVPDEKDLYQAQLDLFLNPNDPAVIEQARADGIPESWLALGVGHDGDGCAGERAGQGEERGGGGEEVAAHALSFSRGGLAHKFDSPGPAPLRDGPGAARPGAGG
jgi:hypothetical protein